MRIFIAVIVLIFSLQSLTKADDIRDLEIEGMSIGDSLLDYFDKESLTTNTADFFTDNTYSMQSYTTKDSLLFEQVSVSYLTDDKNFKAEAISGEIDFPDNINDCYKKMEEVKESLMESLSDIIPKQKVTNKKSAHGVYTYISFIFESGDEISISCYDYDNSKYSYTDGFRLSFETKEFRYWIDNIAYN